MDQKKRILVADDLEMNRDILTEILGEQYEIIEAENGSQVIDELRRNASNIDMLLLDYVMPVMDGVEVLKVMNAEGWIEEIPVIMITAERTAEHIETAYNLGVTDFIQRPFDTLLVQHRVQNTLFLFAKQRKLTNMVVRQIYENERQSNMMIDILSHIVEFRNCESGQHVLNVRILTDLLIRRLMKITDKYPLTDDDLVTITTASALHDIGKISIPSEVINKPGRLTLDEFAIMKTHSQAGSDMIRELPAYQDEPLVKRAYEICRWHHERYDGRGYPDGLTGDEIPISAQIVALADVYDALTSERVYKNAFSHEVALEMILNGECGTFNPLLMQCLREISPELRDDLQRAKSDTSVSALRMETITKEVLRRSNLPI